MTDVTSSSDFPDRETLLSMSGLEFMQAVKLGTMPRATNFKGFKLYSQ